MEESKIKNMVVLKNLPSNLIEEAIVILKSNKKIKKLEKIDNEKENKRRENGNKETQKNEIKKDFIVKEAEMLVSSYISKIENNNLAKKNTKIKENKKYMKLKKYAYFSSFIIFLQFILIIIK